MRCLLCLNAQTGREKASANEHHNAYFGSRKISRRKHCTGCQNAHKLEAIAKISSQNRKICHGCALYGMQWHRKGAISVHWRCVTRNVNIPGFFLSNETRYRNENCTFRIQLVALRISALGKIEKAFARARRGGANRGVLQCSDLL